MSIQTVGVLGAGQMGAGIAQVAASSGFEVILLDTTEALIVRGVKMIEGSLAKFVEKGALTVEQQRDICARINPQSGAPSGAKTDAAADLANFAQADIVIEAIVENLAVKREIFAKLDRICQPETIFASNTSSLSITELMTATSAARQMRFVGLHFFNPVPLMKLVEAVRTIMTDEQVFADVVTFGAALGKTVVTTGDKTGFIVNRLLVPYLLDAIRALETGLSSTREIDEAMRLGCGHPMGPLTLADFIGLDTIDSIAKIMFDEFKEARFAPPALLKRMVLAGLLGRKSGKGFYDYTDPKQPQPLRLQ